MGAVSVMEMRLDDARPAPSSGWLEQEGTVPMKEVSAAFGGFKMYLTRAEAEAGAGNKAAAAAESEAGAGNKAAGGKRRTKTVRVNQAYIDSLLKRYPFKPFPGEPSEIEKKIKDPETRELLRAALAPATALMKASQIKEEAIIKQYLAQGFAEEEVSDDEEA